MLGFVKEVLLKLLSFDGSISTKWLSLNNQLCLGRSTPTDLNFEEVFPGLHLTYSWLVQIWWTIFMVVNLLMIYPQWSLKYQIEYVFPRKTKNVNIKVFNMITRINQSKSLKSNFHAAVHVDLMLKHVIQCKR